MGKGDKKSKKGKRWRGSFGIARNRAAIRARLKRSAGRRSANAAVAAPAKPKRTTKRKAE